MNPGEDEKRQILDPHVFYTIQQLASLMTANKQLPEERALANACVESVATNSRNLLHFFENEERKNKNDDVLAADFGFRVGVIDIGMKIRNRVNKEVAHLTYSRIEHYREDRRDWQYCEFVPLILDRCREFIAHLLETRQVPKASFQQWEALKAHAEQVVYAMRNPKDSATKLNTASTASTTTTTTLTGS